MEGASPGPSPFQTEPLRGPKHHYPGCRVQTDTQPQEACELRMRRCSCGSSGGPVHGSRGCVPRLGAGVLRGGVVAGDFARSACEIAPQRAARRGSTIRTETTTAADGGGFLRRNESAVMVVVAIVAAAVTLLGVIMPEIRDVRGDIGELRTELAGDIGNTNDRIDATNDRIDRVLEALAGIGDVADDIQALRAGVAKLVGS